MPILTKSYLNSDAFKAAQLFIESNARPLDLARFRHHFQQGSVKQVLEELARYQNADGGFGNALEPDLRAPDSSAICTSVAFQILGSLAPEVQEGLALPMIQRGIDYLLHTLDGSMNHWRIIPLEAAHSPRAPWWHEGGRAQSFDDFSLNPTAELLGLLYTYKHFIPDTARTDILTGLTEKVMTYLAPLEEIEMHDLFCCLRLGQAANLPPAVAEPLQSILNRLISNAVETDPAQWQGYGLRPLDVVDEPDSPFMNGLEEAVAANLNLVIASQGDNGAWNPNWTWGDFYPEVWSKAQIEWAGSITVGTLRRLQNFGRLEMLRSDAEPIAA
ncbi:MAG: hypothetical protein AAF702_27000 [Chloroflexota bacterium]